MRGKRGKCATKWGKWGAKVQNMKQSWLNVWKRSKYRTSKIGQKKDKMCEKVDKKGSKRAKWAAKGQNMRQSG